MFTDLRETLMWEKHQLVASHTHPDWGLNPQPRYVPWPGIKPATFWCTGRHSNQPCHPARANLTFKWPKWSTFMTPGFYRTVSLSYLRIFNVIFPFLILKKFYLLIWERDRQTLICCSTCLCIHWLIFICALTGDWTWNPGILGLHCNKLSYLVRCIYFSNIFMS